MEIKEHITYIKKSLVFIVLFGVIAAVVAYVISVQRPPMYKTVLTYEIELINRGSGNDYQYGSYYDLKGAEIFTQHLMSMLHSPAMIEEILQAADVGYEITNINTFTNQFRSDQGSAQDFTVKFSRYNREEAVSIAAAMDIILIERTATGQITTDGSSQFRLRTNPPIIVYQQTNEWLVTITALIAGWLLAIVLIYLRRYLQS